MKNSRAMYSGAKALAVQKGPRQFRNCIGYALTKDEMEKLYLSEGFSKSFKALKDHIEIWKDLDCVKEYPFGADKTAIYFFRLKAPDDLPLLQKIKTTFPDHSQDVDMDFGMVFL